ncbi:uncharacterized protein LOC118484843 [Helianthus annuus]|uniref:uncharacterized protein LOC118484843 n=1 Tax=Helianthus annuus TaxID=4232 RepID=UPI001652BF8E|nr:uncharacterized protein LOC118484843 [Helianthus annuus]
MTTAKKVRGTPVLEKRKNRQQILTPDTNTCGPAMRTRGAKKVNEAHCDEKVHRRKLIILPDSDLDTPMENMEKRKKGDGDQDGPATRTRGAQQWHEDSKPKKNVKRKRIISADGDSQMTADTALPIQDAIGVKKTKK